MSETALLDQTQVPPDQEGAAPLSSEEKLRLDELEAQLDQGSLVSDDQGEFDALTAREHWAHDGVRQARAETNNQTQTPPPKEEPKKPEFDPSSLKIQVVDVSKGVVENARDHAQAHINRETTGAEGRNRFTRFVKGFAKKIWKGNIARDYINLRQQQIARDRMDETGNMYVMQGGNQAQHDQAMAAVVERVNRDLMATDEAKHNLAEIDHGQDLDSRLRELIIEYARSDMTDEALTEAKTRLLQEFGQSVHASDRNKGLMFADNVLEVACNARAAAAHEGGLDRVREALSAQHTEARVGARSETKELVAEKLASRLGKAFSLANETTIATGASIAVMVSKFAVKKALTAAFIAGTAGVGLGAIAWFRERSHSKQDRIAHTREMAEGGGEQLAHAGTRRDQMEATRYRTTHVQELMQGLVTARETAGADANGLRSALDALAQARMRVDLSDRLGVDLIQYSGKTTIEAERLQLLIQMAEARAAVHEALTHADDATLGAAGINREHRGLDAALNDRINGANGLVIEINNDMDARDAAFRKLRNRRALVAAGTAFVVGETIGLGIQEAEAAMRDDLQSVFASHEPGETRQTLLAGIFRDHNGGHAAEIVNGGGNGHNVPVGQHAFVDVPKGYHLQHDGGKWELFDSHHNVVDNHVQFNEHGHFTHGTKQLLEQKGFNFHESKTLVNGHPKVTYSDHHVSPHEYINHHQHQFTHVQRELWYDNDTPGVYDKNELNLWWGGQGGTGVDAHGNYVFSVANMNPDGSSHDGLSADAQRMIHDGKMKIALSVTHGSQDHVIMVDVNEHGQAVIDKDSFAGKALFSHKDGQTHFTGAYAEAVQLTGHHGGAQHMRMLATVVGSNHPNPNALVDRVAHIQPQSHEQYVTTLVPPAESGPLVEVPPVIPIRARSGLEYPVNAALTNPELGGFYYGGKTLEELRAWIAADPNRLHTRKEVVDDDGNVRWVEVDGSPVERSIERERALINAYLSKQAENDTHYRMVEQVAQGIHEMNKDTRVAINIPAWMEEKNLRHLLQEVTGQVDNDGNSLDPNLYEVNILINRKTGSEPDRSVEVIRKFTEDFEAEHGYKPNVNFFDIELDPPYNNVGYARKLLTDAVVLRSVQRPDQNAPLYIETEDADMVDIDKKMAINLISKLDANPNLDAVRGVQDRTPRYLKENDMLFLRRRAADFFEILSTKKAYRDPNNPNWNFTWNRIVTGGWNTGYTAEAYALIEGYDSVEMGEDMSVGEKITMVRGDGNAPNLEVIGKVATRSDSSPRRFIHEILKDKGAYLTGNFSDEEVNGTIRETSIEDALASIQKYARIDESNVEAFTGYIQWLASSVKDVTPNQDEADQFTRRLLFFLGFKKEDYKLAGGSLQINSWDNVKNALEAYRQRFAAK